MESAQTIGIETEGDIAFWFGAVQFFLMEAGSSKQRKF
ncbi:hypothetical protein HMPREF1015_00245 [Bacillus smithii 7_3_47FAA]|jgi:hypothetical protein|uniref:Uncharacterized protein n=1 Tax=Bacillus smithii 7_3_47FAA TaxID=665952 RepID=G9QPM8_9BACI|nr:hypothetical protein BSM4216_2541 [Bacillus smithii]EHL73669.1 hypothetical protein HMPREF1015_00245 [Bacillus smithii 7_3_47FAA]